jgi:hypothetical protein
MSYAPAGRAAMSITPQVREALDRQGIHETGVNKDGYRVEEGPDDSAVVRWGRGEPFRGVQISRQGQDLARCGRALDGVGFNVVPNEFEDADGLYIMVRRRPQEG